MSAARRRAGWPLAASAAGGLLLSGLVWTQGSDLAAAAEVAAPRSVSVLAESGSRDDGSHGSGRLVPVEPAAGPSEVSGEVEDETAAASTDEPDARPRAQRASARDAMVELARLLDGEVFERSVWVAAARAAAHSLDEWGVTDLEAALSRADAPLEQLVAGAEMLAVLRRGAAGSERLPGRTLQALRATQRVLPDDPTAIAAARALASGGTADDADELARRLLFADDARTLEVARWALAACRRPEVAERLAEGTLGLPPGDRLVLTLRALCEMRAASPESVPSEAVELVLRTTSLHLLDPITPPGASAALLAVVEELDREGTRDVLAACLDSADAGLAGRAAQRLVRTGDADAIAGVVDRLRVSVESTERTRLAESLMLAWGTDALAADVRSTVLETFESTLVGSPDAASRRRAALALGTAGDPSAVELLLQVLGADSEARVRGAAANALGRLPLQPDEVEALRRALALEPSPVVRRTLANEVERFPASQLVADV